MITKNNQALKRLTYICLSLSSILLSSDVQAGGCFSKSSSDVKEDASTSYRRHRQSTKIQKETENKKGLLDLAIELGQKEEARAKKVDNLFDKALRATISTVAPKMKNSLVKAIEDFLED